MIEKKNWKKELLDWLKVGVVALILSIGLTQLIKPVLVVGDSMNNTLENRNYLLMNRIAYIGDKTPEAKDIVVFKSEVEGGTVLIKRVIGTPDDHVVIKDGDVFINDEKQTESYIKEDFSIGDVDIIVPKDKYFVMGDNRQGSLDSRFKEVGLVPEDEIIGKVFIRLLPFQKIES